MISVRQLSVHYGAAPALAEVSFHVSPGECVLITGPSGCGKSTLGRVLAGLIPHAIPALVRGELCVAGLDPRQQSVAGLARQVGCVFQNPSAQLFHLSVEDEVAFGPYNLGLPPDEVKDRRDWALETLDLLDLRARPPAGLSGGQKQRVAIASALAMQPQVLILDEPTASLDVPGTNAVMSALQRLRDRLGVTILLIEHRLAEAARLAERTILLDGGRLIADGRTGELLNDRSFMRSLGLRRPVVEPQAAWESLLVPNGHPPEGAEPLVELQQVTAGYNHHAIVRDVDFKLYPGEFAGLVGDNGAGKSTLALVMAGLLKPIRGKVRHLGGRPVRPGLDIALLFQNPAEQLFTDTVDEEVAFGPRNYGLFDSTQHEQTLLEADLMDLRQRRPLACSVGQQQRAALSACLALRPRLVILDEPTLGQDWGHLQRLMDYLLRLNRQGTAVLLITHDYKLIHRYARRVILLKAGQVCLDGRLSTNPEGGPA